MRQTIFEDAKLTLFQAAINDQFSKVQGVAITKGILITNQTISGTTTINHSLGRKASGYMVTSINSNVNIWNDSFSGTSSITFHCSGTATVDLWVF